eukprot:IDg19108t1
MPQRGGGFAHSLWSALYAQWVRNAAMELLESSTHRGTVDHLWRLSPTIFEAMDTTGLDQLSFGNEDLEKTFKDLIFWICMINWRLVDSQCA